MPRSPGATTWTLLACGVALPARHDLSLLANGKSFEPFGEKAVAGVYVHLPQPPRPRVHELVRYACRHHHDLPALRLDLLVACREGGGALLHRQDLLVRVPVQPRAAPGGASTTIKETFAPR